MGAVLSLSAWLGLAALQGGPSIAGRMLDAQTGDAPPSRSVRAESGPPAAVRPARSAPPQSLPLPMGCLHALGRRAQRAQPQERIQRRVDAPHGRADRPIQQRSAARVPVAPSIGLSVQF
jgi:hypothetical protein